MAAKWQKGCGIGCLVLFSAAVILMGAATWYAREINGEYKEVQKTEDDLLAATEDLAFTPPPDLVLRADRLEAFLAVRDSLAAPRFELVAQATEFARQRNRGRGRGLKEFLRLLDSGSELAPFYAAYWIQRNRSLLAHEMGPDEYIWLYSVVYYQWLQKDPADGRDGEATAPTVRAQITGALPSATLDLLAPHRLRLEAGYSPVINPVELIFSAAPASVD